ncbi:MAG TPA: ATP-binding protein, partial [Ktedonobacterales bacterium]|nr:ATP-binding protein [Ktedonobacterales bacterium]
MDQVSKRMIGTPAATKSVGANGARPASRTSGERLFAGGGETGAQLASVDWTKTSLGPVETWPQTLRTSLRICLSSRHAMIVWWGPDLIFFYNDAYAPTLGIKRPWAAGKPGHEVWSEIWPTIGPMLERVLRTGEPTWSNDEQLLLERSGYVEETYHTYSYSPIEDETGAVVGVFTAVTETTDRVLAERRTGAARDLATALVDSRSTEDVCARAAQVLATDPADVPIALLYGLDMSTRRATLLSSIGVAGGGPLSPETVELDVAAGASGAAQSGGLWSLAHVARTGQETLIENISWQGATLEVEPGLMPHDALALPLIEAGQSTPTAILVAGVSPLRALDIEYRAFYTVLANHLATALSAAHAYEAERKRAEALAEIDRAKTTFFSNVSHEFRTPLTLMLGPLEDMLARRATLPAVERGELELMHRNSMRLLKLVNTLLDFARIEAGRVQASYAPTDLPRLTAELASSFRSLVEKAGMDLIVDCPPLDAVLAAPVYVDREMWEKIVLNLLSNAFKFTFAGSITVALREAEQGRAVELVVRDTGVGIPATELPRLFERFHRVEGAQSRTHEGSGIGLALVQELAHLHGGTIRAESEEGVGTTFFVRMPTGMAHLPADRVQASVALASTALGAATYVDEAERWLPMDPNGESFASLPDVRDQDAALLSLADASASGAHGVGAHGQRLARIVLADDNADLRDYLTRLLRESYEVEAVANGAQALAAIRREAPDLAISDVMMPELDGFGLLRELRADPQTMNLPVILLSARAGEEATVEGLEAGADDYLVKPFSARELLSRVAARLEISRMRDEAGQRMHETLMALLSMAEALVTTSQEDALDLDAWQGELAASEWRAAAPSAGAVRRVLALVQRVLGGRYTAATLADIETDTLTPLGVVGVPPEMEERWWLGLGRQPVSSFLPSAYLERLMAEDVIEQDLSAQPPVRGQDYFNLGRTLIVGQPLPDRQLCIIGIEVLDRPALTQQERDLARAAVRLVALVVERV